MELIQHAKSFFTDHHNNQPKPVLSEHSTSNSVAHTDHHILHLPISTINHPTIVNPRESNLENENDGDSEGDDDDGEDNEDDNDEIAVETDTDAELDACNVRITQHIMTPNLPPSLGAPTSEPSELMQIEMSEGIRLGSLDDRSNNLDTELQILMASHTSSSQSDHLLAEDGSYRAWDVLHENLCSAFPESPGIYRVAEKVFHLK